MENKPNSSFEKLVLNYEQNGLLRPTLNKAGWQMNALDQYGQVFVEYAKTCKRPILDLAVAFGYTSTQLLEAGASVIANDISKEMLDELRNSLDTSFLPKIQFIPGNALELHLESNSLDGIWANRFFHYLRPAEVSLLIRKFFNWLAPGGKVCITAASQFFTQCDITVYEERVKSGNEWPGFFDITADKRDQWDGIVPFFQCISVDVLEREVKKAGFIVERSTYLARPFSGTNGKEASALIAVKPAE